MLSLLLLSLSGKGGGMKPPQKEEGMKLWCRILGVAVIAAAMTWANGALASIEGSAHDFSDEAWSTNDICGPCHTPHNAFTGGAPLWNHSNTTVAAWTMYDNTNGTQNSTVPSAPSTVSKACLSCHDGSIAVDSFGGAPGSVNISSYPGKQVGASGNLANDHPISITYNTALATADGGLYNPTNAAVAALLLSDKVECASCHDVHNTAANPSLLTVDNTDSALCLTCHNK